MTQIQSHPVERWTASGCALYKRVGQSFTQAANWRTWTSGGGGIRTHGTVKRYTGFRDRPFQPLRHPSSSVFCGQLSVGRAAGWSPAQRPLQFTNLPPFLEEFAEDFAAFHGEHAAGDVDAMVEPRIRDESI